MRRSWVDGLPPVVGSLIGLGVGMVAVAFDLGLL